MGVSPGRCVFCLCCGRLPPKSAQRRSGVDGALGRASAARRPGGRRSPRAAVGGAGRVAGAGRRRLGPGAGVAGDAAALGGRGAAEHIEGVGICVYAMRFNTDSVNPQPRSAGVHRNAVYVDSFSRLPLCAFTVTLRLAAH